VQEYLIGVPWLVQDGNCPVAVFYADSGTRIGTYQGHNGAVLTCDITRAFFAAHRASETGLIFHPCLDLCPDDEKMSTFMPKQLQWLAHVLCHPMLVPCHQLDQQHPTNGRNTLAGDSKWLMTAGQDSSVRLWDVQTGSQLFIWESNQPARACAFAKADPHLAVYTTDQFSTTAPSIRFVRIAERPQDSDQTPLLHLDRTRLQRCAAAPLLPMKLDSRRLAPSAFCWRLSLSACLVGTVTSRCVQPPACRFITRHLFTLPVVCRTGSRA
jgi:hypothetical protein